MSEATNEILAMLFMMRSLVLSYLSISTAPSNYCIILLYYEFSMHVSFNVIILILSNEYT